MEAFSGVDGQDRVASYLSRALEGGQLTHAYLLAGGDEAVRRELAGRFAAAVVADGDSRVFDRALRDGHPDLRRIAPGGAGAYLVEQVRELVADAALSPIRARHKAYVLTRAELLAGAPANALLKTLEEPPADVVCVLCASAASAVLPTLRSRCVVLRLAGADAGSAAEAPEDTRLFELLFALAGRADNRRVLAGAKDIVEAAGDGTAEIERRRREDSDAYGDYLSAGARKAMEERFRREERASVRGGLDRQLAAVRSWLRDCLLVAQGADGLARHAYCERQTAQVAGQAGSAALLEAIAAVDACEQRIHYNVTPQLACEAMLFEIRRALCR